MPDQNTISSSPGFGMAGSAVAKTKRSSLLARRKLGILPDSAGRLPACPSFLRSRLAKEPTSKMLAGRDSLEGYPPV